MIAHLQGILSHKSAQSIVIDVHGIGYGLSIPLSTFYHLPEEGSHISLAVHTHVREDAITLFGFQSTEEKALFQRMITVSGIGPRLALNILSGIRPDDFITAIMVEDMNRLTTIPGVGRKVAERLIFELKDKLATDGIDSAGHRSDRDVVLDEALSALVNLGYKETLAKKAVDRVTRECDDTERLEVLLTESLKYLSK